MIKIKNYIRKVFIIRIDVILSVPRVLHPCDISNVRSQRSDNVYTVYFNIVLFSFNKSFISFIIAFNRFSCFSNIAVVKEIYLENSYTCQLYYPNKIRVDRNRWSVGQLKSPATLLIQCHKTIKSRLSVHC